MTEYIAMWKNYANFSDRTTRKGYWMAALIGIPVNWLLAFISIYVIGNDLLVSLYSLAVFIPSISISVRRLRDAGRHWAWIFVNFVPIIGQIVFLVMVCQRSIPQNNIPQV